MKDKATSIVLFVLVIVLILTTINLLKVNSINKRVTTVEQILK